MKTLIRSTRTTFVADLVEWCRAINHKHNNPKFADCNPRDRFLIGFYQLAGLWEWRGSSVNKNESLASAMLHFMMCLDMLGGASEDVFTYTELTSLPEYSLNEKELLARLTYAGRLVFYSKRYADKSYQRGARYSLQALTTHLGACIRLCLCAIPKEDRSQAIEDATAIMSGRL